MYRKTCLFVFPLAAFTLLFAGCSSVTTSGPGAASAFGTTPVSLSMTDDPPNGVDVLDFQVILSAASLQPSSGSAVSLLPNDTPVTIDVTNLQALTQFLSSINIPAGTYTSLSLTFANPKLVIYNISDASLGSACAVGKICQFAPTGSDSITISSAPFPITISANTPLGFLVDFHLNRVLKSDLTMDLAAASGISISTLDHVHPHFGFLDGSVQTVTASQNQFTVKTRWGNTFTVNTSSSTTYIHFPADVCTTGGIACVQAGQRLALEVTGVETNGDLDVSEVKYISSPDQIVVEGVVVGVTPASSSSGQASIQVLLHEDQSGDDDNGDLPEGGQATVTIASNAAFAIDSDGFTLPAGMSFTGANDLTVGQEVAITVSPGSVMMSGNSSDGNGWAPPSSSTFTATSVELEPSQMSGTVSALASPDFTLNSIAGFFCWSRSSTPSQVNVTTTTQTEFDNFTTDSFSGLAVNDMVSVDGWLFAPSASGTTTTTTNPPTVVAKKVVQHEDGDF